MLIVQKGAESVSVLDTVSADELMRKMIIAGCTESLTKRTMIGSKVTQRVFEIVADDIKIAVHGQDDAERVIHWLLGLGVDAVEVMRATE